jgi:hypothetical protein
METPGLSFRNFNPTPALRLEIYQRLLRLEQILGGRSRGGVIRCTVTLETPHRHHRLGRIRHVRIRMTLPKGEIVVAREPARDGAHEDLSVALRDAFKAARRQIDAHLTYRRPRLPRISASSGRSPAKSRSSR